MRLQHEFTLPIPPDQAWTTLLDIERVAPCMPGAALDHVNGDEFSGRVTLKVGPLRLTYRGDARIEDRDDAARTLVIAAQGKEARGSGTASATVSAALTESDGGTRVALTTDLALTGRPAQFGRGLVNEVAGTMIGQFAERLSREMAGGAAPRQELADAPTSTRARDTYSHASAQATPIAETATGSDGVSADGAAENTLDVLALAKSTVGTRGLVALGGLAGLVAAFVIGRRLGRNGAARPGAFAAAHQPWPAVFVIDAGER